MTLDDLIGKRILVMMRDSEVGLYTTTVLRGVETGGLWLEGKELDTLAQGLVAKAPKGQPPQRAIFFFPFAQIQFVLTSSAKI
jgi:hypothetical protein